MTDKSLFRRFVWNTRARVLFLFVVAILLGLHWTVGSSTSRSHAATAVATNGATCGTYSSGVYCELPAGDDAYDVPSLLAQAQGLNPSITQDTPMGIAAVGGEGARGACQGCEPVKVDGQPGGASGLAETQFTASRWEGRFGSTMYYYVGDNGTTSIDGATGGAATIVSAADLTSGGFTPCLKNVGTTCADSDAVLLIAGGGGGGAIRANFGGGAGGKGGHAVATTETSAEVAGSNGASADEAGGGGGGGGGGSSNGGTGGNAGAGASATGGTAGNDGIGGLGGAVHTPNGPSNPTVWSDPFLGAQGTLDAIPAAVGTNGEGGEGEWRCSGCDSSAYGGGGGGGGGGGWGGGGGGGYGGYAVDSGGGGGGGSYADKASTTYSGSFPTVGADPEVVVAFITG